MTKYAPLQDHLAELSKSGKDEWNTNFKTIETVLGSKLPPSAFKYNEWWANEKETTPKVQCHAWRRAGWKTAFVNNAAKTISFIKMKSKARDANSVSREYTFSLRYKWTCLGSIHLDHQGRLKFPAAQKNAGIYKLEVNMDDDQFIYIGEAEDFKQRFQRYRTPGVKKSTNLRLNQIMLKAMSGGGRVNVHIMGDMKLQKFDLTAAQIADKNKRKLFECAAIEASKTSRAVSLNL